MTRDCKSHHLFLAPAFGGKLAPKNGFHHKWVHQQHASVQQAPPYKLNCKTSDEWDLADGTTNRNLPTLKTLCLCSSESSKDTVHFVYTCEEQATLHGGKELYKEFEFGPRWVSYSTEWTLWLQLSPTPHTWEGYLTMVSLETSHLQQWLAEGLNREGIHPRISRMKICQAQKPNGLNECKHCKS